MTSCHFPLKHGDRSRRGLLTRVLRLGIGLGGVAGGVFESAAGVGGVGFSWCSVGVSADDGEPVSLMAGCRLSWSGVVDIGWVSSAGGGMGCGKC